MVTLINAFYVKRGCEDEFILMWNETARLMNSQPGFINTKLHRSLNPDSTFSFVNVALWESEETWREAMGSSAELHEWRSKLGAISEAHPALYNVAVEYERLGKQ